MTTELSKTQISTLSAALKGIVQGIPMANSRERAIARFHSVAAEVALPDPAFVLGLEFAAALDRCKAHYDAQIDLPEPAGDNPSEAEALAGQAEAAANCPPPMGVTVEPPASKFGKTPYQKRRENAARKTRPLAIVRDEPEAETPKEPKPAKEKPLGKKAAIEEAARNGLLPSAPDFSAPTHARFRKKLDELVQLAKEAHAFHDAEALAQLKAMVINPVSSSPKAMAKYRDLAVLAIEARYKEKGWSTEAAA